MTQSPFAGVGKHIISFDDLFSHTQILGSEDEQLVYRFGSFMSKRPSPRCPHVSCLVEVPSIWPRASMQLALSRLRPWLSPEHL